MSHFYSCFMQLFLILTSIIIILFILVLWIPGRHFDRRLKTKCNQLNRMQRAIHYAFCLFDMSDTNYQLRKNFCIDFDFIQHARNIDIIITSLFAGFIYMLTGTAIILYVTYFIVFIYHLLLIFWHGEYNLWSHFFNIY
jgi:hypothetical protein